MLPVDSLPPIQLLQRLSMLESHSPVGIDEKGHEGRQENIDNKDRVNYHKAKGPHHIVVSHELKVQQAHVQEEDGQESI